MPDHFIIRPITRKDVDLFVDWAADERWSPGLYDVESFYAADPEGFFIGKLNGEPVYLDITAENPDALALVNKYKMSFMFETARMYTAPAPKFPLEKIYGITSFELG